MAALLTSEMGDTDKIVKYIEECRAIGVEVKPPDVNASSVQFSVHDDTIRFGLAAIKNVGEAAMETILKTRAADGPFTTLDDFCVSGHPLARFKPLVESLGITASSELAARPGGSRVLLFGQVASLREIPTKSGNRMAFVTIEDTDGTVDVTIFPEPFKAAAGL